ncbi:uncharacterized protein LOC119730034 [Patiria miniata]|uniref:Uncharacterized protein n=1 Tax=Patiria miniata TaxID=46514 RepID=A0A914A4H5_PATMI|nr:uncharacterized protein LOC119730034 [Patiria miniata]
MLQKDSWHLLYKDHITNEENDYQRINVPLCELNTNLPKAKVDESFVKELSQLIASTVNKPERGVTLRVNPDQVMMKEGTLDPVVTMTDTGFLSQHFTDAMREKWMTTLTPFLSEKLGITDHGRYKDKF